MKELHSIPDNVSKYSHMLYKFYKAFQWMNLLNCIYEISPLLDKTSLFKIINDYFLLF